MSSSTPPPPPNPLRDFAIRLRAAAPGGGKLSKEQKQFNKLVKDIDALRTTIAQWQAFEPKFRLRLATEIEPLIARYRASRLEVVMLLKSAIDGKELGKRQKSKAREILCWHVSELLADGADEALIALYDQYADRSFAQQRMLEAERLIDRAGDVPGLERDGDEEEESLDEEDLARFIDERLAEERDWHAGQRGAAQGKRAKAQAGSARHAQLLKDANAAVRQIYRKLASELHPDREADVDERARKTALMQEANQAYAASDLLSLLALQLQVEQLDSARLSGLARERLQQYNHLLGEQCEQLRYQLMELVAGFTGHRADDMSAMTPAAVERALDREARDYKRAARACESDVAYFRNVRNIKDALDDYRLGDVGEEDF